MTKVPKISYTEYLNMARNPDTPDEELVKYSIVIRGKTAFSPQLSPNPKLVRMTADDKELENAMQLGNGLARFRRQLRFKRRLLLGENLPVLVSEGDSWFQFPLLINEVIDHLGDDYLIWSVDAAGDTLDNMVNGSVAPEKTEYLTALREQKKRVKAFLFSAAGNDIIGEDPITGKPVLEQLINPFNGNPKDVIGHVNLAALGKKLAFIEAGYQTVINSIRSEQGLAKLPIIIHGYDYTFPYPWGKNDERDPAYADKDEWLGKPLDKRKIKDQELRRAVIKVMLDALYDVLFKLAGDSKKTQVFVVDCRGSMPNLSDWNDEIHGTSDGFGKVADRFRAVINKAIP
ncbi:MAG: hypothetical protein IPJ50_07905 [Betaproteobacteria bacterium]|jgi:hypothetical protein|nr:hypothetical protein [Betaproteobacteria bacterium]